MPREFNHIAAFIEFSKGVALEEIAHGLAVPLNLLQRWRSDEKWDLLAPRLPVAPLPSSGRDAAQALERVKANREKNLEIAQALQEDLIGVIGKLRADTLRVKRVFANGSILEVEPGLRERCDLALYAKNVADISYRALGDVPDAGKNAQGDGGGSSAGQITIVFPPLVAAPRQERTLHGTEKALTIDIQAVTPDLPGLLGSVDSGATELDSDGPGPANPHEQGPGAVSGGRCQTASARLAGGEEDPGGPTPNKTIRVEPPGMRSPRPGADQKAPNFSAPEESGGDTSS